MVDVDPETFNISVQETERAITNKTRAVVPVHLFGQCAEMEPLMELAGKHGLYVIEDNAQSLGAECRYNHGNRKAGTIGHIGTYSFFPTKNLGCFGDGGALSTNDAGIAEKIRMIASHGQRKKYFHEIIGCNSRLDTLQAAVLDVKLKYLNVYIASRQKAAALYDRLLEGLEGIGLPFRAQYGNHTFNQYTLKVQNGKRDQLQKFLKEKGVPSVIYYPLPLCKQPAFESWVPENFTLPVTEELCGSVLSIPMHTELTPEIQYTISECIKSFVLNS
jgi:dTDP-4-amino-4,6-dideoxygalactose transaminase